MQREIKISQFRFTNCVTHMEGYRMVVGESWQKPMKGRPMAKLWYKLLRLHGPISRLSKHLSNVNKTIAKARTDLRLAQEELCLDRMNSEIIDKVKSYTDSVIYWHEINDQMMRQRTKIDWLRKGDSNTDFFYASLKAKHAATSIKVLHKDDGSVLQNSDAIAAKICDFYKNLMGSRDSRLQMIDITVMREGPQLSGLERNYLIAPITLTEIKSALKGIGDLKSPGIDGYGEKIFKSSWEIIEQDLIDAVREFFEHNVIYKAMNETIVTLIPKHPAAKTIHDYRPIEGCSIFYKILSKILTARLGKVLGSVINKAQIAFVTGKHIQNHILLATELIKGYNRKMISPRCMIQLDL